MMSDLCYLYSVGGADVRQSVASFRGYMSHCDGYETTAHVLRKFILRRNHE